MIDHSFTPLVPKISIGEVLYLLSNRLLGKAAEIKFNWLNTVNVSIFALYSHHNLGTVNILLGGRTIGNNAQITAG